MKQFVKSVQLFAFPFVFFIVITGLMAISEWRVFISSLHAPNIVIGVIGDSHCQYAIADTNTQFIVNFAHRASPTPFWLAKAKLAIRENPQIQSMLIGVYPDVFLRAEEDDVKRLRFSRNHTPATIMMDVACNDIMRPFDYYRIIPRSWSGVIHPFLSRLITDSKQSPLHERWFVVDKNAAERDSAIEKDGFVFDGLVPKGHSKGWYDIERILSFLRAKCVRAVLLTVPIPKATRCRYSDEQLKYYESEIKELEKTHGCVRLDYMMEMQEDENFCDHFHLNKCGALRFTKLLECDLQKLRMAQ